VQIKDKRFKPGRLQLIEEYIRVHNFQNASKEPPVLIIPRSWVRFPPPAPLLPVLVSRSSDDFALRTGILERLTTVVVLMHRLRPPIPSISNMKYHEFD
jgi:hypothetical protein